MKGFYRGLGVVKGEGVAAAKKRSPSHLNKEKKLIIINVYNILNPQKIKINLKFKFSKTKNFNKKFKFSNGVPHASGTLGESRGNGSHSKFSQLLNKFYFQ